MSKVDAQRALRDARYAAYRASRAAAGAPVADAPPSPLKVRVGTPPAATSPADPATSPVTSPVTSPAVTRAADEPGRPAPGQDGQDAAPQLCGHRNIGNKSCQRPAGHSEKNHRYK